jgi:hypothetical protein
MLRRLLIGCAVLAVISGCGTNPPSPSAASSSPPAAGTKTSLAKTSAGKTALAKTSAGKTALAKTSAGKTSVGTTESPRQRAEADAAALLASFVPSPGARKLAAAPGADGGVLGHPQMEQDTPDIVDDAASWQVPGQAPQAMLSWEAAHVSHRFKLDA